MDAQKVMTLKECRLHIHEALSKIYPKTEIDSFFFLMIEEKLNLQRIDTVLKPDLLISFGLGDNWSFEKHCLKLAIVNKCMVFDHTVGLSTFYAKFFTRLHKTPTELKALAFRLIVIFRYFTDFSSAKLQHIKKEITRDSNSSTSTNLAAIANNIPTVLFMLKADIEGAEYEIIKSGHISLI